jgi:hypothetical protein
VKTKPEEYLDSAADFKLREIRIVYVLIKEAVGQAIAFARIC